MKKVSFLMTVYNGAKVIRESIPPIMHQTYNNIEIVIVNDGSSDDSAAIIQEYCNQDKRIVFVNRSENKGRVYSLNEGLEHCTGDYVAINDADDISTETRIEEMLAFIAKKGIEDKFGVVGSANITEDRTTGKRSTYKIKTGTLGDRVSIARIFLGMPFIHSSFIYSNHALKDVNGFANEVTSSIDYFTLNKISRNYPIYAYRGVTVIRLIDGNNYFLKPQMINKKTQNREIIHQWQNDNFKMAPLYSLIRKIRKGI